LGSSAECVDEAGRGRATLAPFYAIAKALLPNLDISPLNIAYYASLADYYTIYDLRRLPSGLCHLYLLCYAWQRYRQLSDNLVDALGYHMQRIRKSCPVVSHWLVQDEGAPSSIDCYVGPAICVV
jgi:hypothetical protein